MIRSFTFDREQDLPIVAVKLFGRGRHYQANLVFDSGAACTQINTFVINELGYSAADAHALATAHGPAGPMQNGYALEVDELKVLGKKFIRPTIAAYDFDHFENIGIDGLLGFDLIKQLHLESAARADVSASTVERVSRISSNENARATASRILRDADLSADSALTLLNSNPHLARGYHDVVADWALTFTEEEEEEDFYASDLTDLVTGERL